MTAERKVGLHPIPTRFDPKGPGYDNRFAKEARRKWPLTAPRPEKYTGKDVIHTDSHDAWVWHDDTKKYFRHGSSMDPKTGRLLKGKKYPTYGLTEAEEKRRGNKIVKGKGGYYYSVPDVKK